MTQWGGIHCFISCLFGKRLKGCSLSSGIPVRWSWDPLFVKGFKALTTFHTHTRRCVHTLEMHAVCALMTRHSQFSVSKSSEHTHISLPLALCSASESTFFPDTTEGILNWLLNSSVTAWIGYCKLTGILIDIHQILLSEVSKATDAPLDVEFFWCSNFKTCKSCPYIVY